MRRITVLAGGVGGARFLRGLLAHLGCAPGSGGGQADITVVANTGDDLWLHGLRVCPDLDTIMYTLGGSIDEEQGWGRAGESRRTAGEIHAYGRGWDWFTLGDLDLATHIVRTEMLRNGATLSEAVAFLGERWQLPIRLLPMSDDPVETHIRVAADIDEHRAGDLIHFEEWWVRYRARVPAREIVQVGLGDAVAAPGVLEAIRTADIVVMPPSNPVVSIGTILAVPGVRDALRTTAATVVGVSPLIAGSAVRGMAEECLGIIGCEASALGVAKLYGSRLRGGLLDGWLVDTADRAVLAQLADEGIQAAAVPLWMSDLSATASLAGEALALSSRRGAGDSPGTPDRPQPGFPLNSTSGARP